MSAVQVHEVHVTHGSVTTTGDLALPEQPRGAIAFAHGTGSSRHSARNRMVAEHLQHLGFATLLMDLLTEEEERADRAGAYLRFDFDLLAHRLVDAVDQLAGELPMAGLPVGLFGASTGAAAALVGAARRPDRVGAVVSRGGRPDLAAAALEQVRAPTLFIVGSRDTTIIDLNLEAQARLGAASQFEIVDGATHLFDEPGVLEHVAWLAGGWFERHLAVVPVERSRR